MDQLAAQSNGKRAEGRGPFAVLYHLLGVVPFDACWQLQQRLVYEISGRGDGHITVLLCEHPWLISIGRLGSRGHIQLSNEQLRHRQLEMRWVSRGGGCILHGPGQLAIYPIVHLDWHGWTVGEYLDRLSAGLAATVEQLGVPPTRQEGFGGLWGRSGQLVQWGISVRNWTTSQGAFLNVNPQMTCYPYISSAGPLSVGGRRKMTMGSLFAERRQAVTMSNVRATLIPRLAAAWGTDRYHLVTGHPLLKRIENSLDRAGRNEREARNRAS
jgi:lipoyl(octanoyl) transferase